MKIIPSTPEDLAEIRSLFNEAIEFQKIKFGKHWQTLNEAVLLAEIGERLHWKVPEEGRIAAFFSIAFTDTLVWDGHDTDPAIYLHRIVTNPAFRGRGYVRHITAWAKTYGGALGKKFVRLDTDSENAKLNAYYGECGYHYRGKKIFHDPGDPRVPKHYFGAGLSLYEMEILLSG